MENPENKEKKKLLKKLKHKYRLVVMNDATFEERWSFLLSPLNVFTAVGIITITVIVLTILLIAFTGLKQFVPGYPDQDIRDQAYDNAKLLEDQQAQIEQQAAYIQNLQIILNGGVPGDTALMRPDSINTLELGQFENSEFDSIQRVLIEQEDRYNVIVDPANSSMSGVLLFTPVRGSVSGSFNTKTGHYGVDIVSPNKDETIKSVLDGVVIFASYTSDGGKVIQVQHANGIVSVYKHNSTLLKNVGDDVKAGEPIAIIGNTGEETDGPHLHFELWQNGRALDPQKYLVF